MFTGLIEEIGAIVSVQPRGGGRRITVKASKIMDDVKIDDSISINGACQTVVGRTDTTFDVEAVEETLKKTTLAFLKSGARVNLERAMRSGDRFGGHIVQGHVDTTGTVHSIEKQTMSWLIWIEFPREFAQYIVPVGSICIDGVSLTVARIEGTRLMVSVIPHTVSVTTLKDLHSGSTVNLEFDIIGKYVERLMSVRAEAPVEKKSSLEEMLRGY
jgi:riboflavin synthase